MSKIDVQIFDENDNCRFVGGKEVECEKEDIAILIGKGIAFDVIDWMLDTTIQIFWNGRLILEEERA